MSSVFQIIENNLQETQYSRWMAACRMAAKGKTMADRGYDAEVKSIQAFLSMQHPASQPVINPATLDIQVEEYVAPRFLKRLKSKVQDILIYLVRSGKKSVADCMSLFITVLTYCSTTAGDDDVQLSYQKRLEKKPDHF